MIEKSKLYVGKKVWWIDSDYDFEYEQIKRGKIVSIDVVDKFNGYTYYYVECDYGAVANFESELYEKKSEAMQEVLNIKQRRLKQLKSDLKNLESDIENMGKQLESQLIYEQER